ncbi:MAG: carbonic anhydrase [Paracoccaceae bacterium]
MKTLAKLFEQNKLWAEEQELTDPGFFEKLAKQQSPRYLWIGCSDSRVPANQITGLNPGEVFVHRNVANVVSQTDLNMLSVVQFAVEVLKVEHVIVCGHYGCGGVSASVDGIRHGLIDNWIRNIGDIAEAHEDELKELSEEGRKDRLCELNVLTQKRNLSRTTVIQDAWQAGHDVKLHSWIYRLTNGRLTDLGLASEGEA